MDILDAIGNTSIVRLRRVVPQKCAAVYAKLEWENPTGSMKDRMAQAVIARAEADGRLKPGDAVVEYTGGSTGASLALVCAAKGYRLRVYRSKDLSTPLVDKKTNEAKATVDPGVLSEGSYRWSATALDDAGNEKVGGRMNQMDIIFDNSLTSLHIITPRDGDRADGAKATGTAPLGAKLYINGKPVSTDGSGRFAQPLPKADSVIFRLVMQDGSESYWYRRLKK